MPSEEDLLMFVTALGTMVTLMFVIVQQRRLYRALSRRTLANDRGDKMEPVVVIDGKWLESVLQRLLTTLSDYVSSADEIEKSKSATHQHRFVIDSILLREFYSHVCGSVELAGQCGPDGERGFREAFHYAGGVQVDPQTFVITRLVPVKFSKQSAFGVRVSDPSNIAALRGLDEAGLDLVAHFHSHPGYGPGANNPSLTDQRFQERLERGGHVAIGGIFCRDMQASVGHLRFFAGDQARFIVDVVGNYVKKVDDHVYKISLADGGFHTGAVAD